MPRLVTAFDRDAIHDGNHALSLDEVAHARVDADIDSLLSRMTLAQKIQEIRGRQVEPIDGLYSAGGDSSLGIAPWKMVDGPRGARTGTATAFPVAIARAATFDVALERRVGLAIGQEVAARGGNVLLAPTINLLRHPGWGRAQETYSEDPHHTGAMGAAFVSGAQNFVLASPKHFALNNIELTRFEMTSNVEPRVLHEIYLPHFKRCVVEAGAASIMSAYNKVNGTYCGEHPQLLTEILRDQWGFRGFVESDWFLGTRSTAPSLRAGLDIEMPAGYRFSDEELEAAFSSGELSEEEVTAAAGHSLRQKIAWELTEESVAGKPRPDPSVVECEAHVALAREVATKSLVLLENRDEALPLKPADGTIAVTGVLADEPNLGDRGSSMVTPSSEIVTVWQGIEARGIDASLVADDQEPRALADYETVVIVVGLTYREEGEFIPTMQQEAEGGELARGGDRRELTLPADQVARIRQVAAVANRTVVVIEGGSAIVIDEWVDDVDAVVMAWYPGQQGGHAVADVLLGDAAPSGRLPVSIPRHADDLPPWDVEALSIEHDFLHGYGWLHHHDRPPAYAFGFGLTYTTFEYLDLRVERAADGVHCLVDVANTGTRRAAAVPQLYVSWVDSRFEHPPLALQGFARVELEPGESVRVAFDVAEESLSVYEVETTDWRLEECVYRFTAGSSATDRPLSADWRFA